MAGPLAWKFTQKGASGAGATLTLDGPNAPFGRPRKGAVAEKERELRQTATYYAGNRVPDRHVFGDKQNPIVLTGRFMDSRIGSVGGAQAKADEVDAFVAAQRPISGQWGGILAFTGLLAKVKFSYESDAEIAWTLTMELDSDDTQPVSAPVAPASSASDLLSFVQGLMVDLETNILEVPPDIEFKPTFLDGIASLISDANSVTGALSSFADSVDNFESTLAADANRFKSGMLQVATTVEKLQISLETGENDAVIVAGKSESQTQWFAISTAMDKAALDILDYCEQAILVAELALQGQPDVTIIAAGGDTWESLATTYLGSASQTEALRAANGARYGTPPQPGQSIHIPKSA